MPRDKNLPCDPGLDAELVRYYDPEGESIGSILRLASGRSTDPTRLTRLDAIVESSKLLDGLSYQELESVEEYYRWRMIGDHITRIAAHARAESRRYRRRRAFKSGIKEAERRYREKRK